MTQSHLHLTTSPTQNVLVLSPEGEWDMSNAEQLRVAVLDAVESSELIVLDLATTTFVDSVVIGVVIRGYKRAAELGRRLVVVNATGIVEKALSVTGALSFLASSPPPSLTLLTGGRSAS